MSPAQNTNSIYVYHNL